MLKKKACFKELCTVLCIYLTSWKSQNYGGEAKYQWLPEIRGKEVVKLQRGSMMEIFGLRVMFYILIVVVLIYVNTHRTVHEK